MPLLKSAVAAALLISALAPAQQAGRDPACKEHPLIPRVPGATLEDCRMRLFDEHEFAVSASGDAGTASTRAQQGRLHLTQYRIPKAIALDVLAQYRALLEKQKFAVVDESEQTPFIHVLTLRRAAPTEVWIQIAAETFNEGEFSESRIAVLEKTKLPERLRPSSAAAPKGVRDAENCRDLLEIGRMEGARIESCVQRPDEPSTLVARQLETKAETVRGEMSMVTYVETPQTSALEAALSYEAALKKTGWEILEHADGGAQHVLLAKKAGAEQPTFLIVSSESVNDDRWVRTTVSTFVPHAP